MTNPGRRNIFYFKGIEINILTLEEAINLTRDKVRELHKNYLNASLAGMLGLLDLDKVFVRAAGVSVWDTEGREYLDFLGGFGSLNLGHNHPRLAGEYTGTLVAGELLNKHGIITAYTLNNPNVIRLEPPLTVTYEQIDLALNALEDIFTRHKGFLSMAASGAGVIIKTLTGGKNPRK